MTWRRTRCAHDDAGDSHDLNLQDMDPDTGFFMQKPDRPRAEGFIWQKLREPRSYDYKKTENKGYNERLRMPKFNFDEQQVEAVITFVLGLVAEPPATQYVYQPSPRRQAIVEGQKVLEKFNCGGCHMLQMEQWKLAYEPGDFGDPRRSPTIRSSVPKFTPQQLRPRWPPTRAVCVMPRSRAYPSSSRHRFAESHRRRRCAG